MKSFKELVPKLISYAAAATFCAALPLIPSLKAEAATTYQLKYDVDVNEWRVQVDEDSWKDDDGGKDLYYLNHGDDAVKDGDVVVICPNEENPTDGKEITINAHLSNLTVNRSNAVVYTNGIDNCYVLGDSYAAINGDVSNAYVYDNASCNFNNNVTNLNMLSSTGTEIESKVVVKGTVAYAVFKDNTGSIMNEYYNFAPNTFWHDAESSLRTDPSDYSTTGSGAVDTATNTPAASTADTTPAQSTASASDYDDVPKTGESHLVVWLFGCSALCLAGCLVSRKRSAVK